jgi:predicted GNAT family acetyltransferase
MYDEYHAWLVAEESDLRMVASCTPPWNFIISDSDDNEVVEAMVDALAHSGVISPGVTGNRPTVDRFVEAWLAATSVGSTMEMGQGVFSLEVTTDVEHSPGRARAGVESDRDLLVSWWRAFLEESHSGGEASKRHASERVDQRLAASGEGIDVWEVDGEPMSMSGHGDVLNSVRIGPVYTPPDLRGHGYATSLVHEQSRRFIGAGRDHCLLYTDLANPTSNAIYRKIGYHQVAESIVYRFDPKTT